MRFTESAVYAGLLSLTLAGCAGSPIEGESSTSTDDDDATMSDAGLSPAVDGADGASGPVLGGADSDASLGAPLAPDAGDSGDSGSVDASAANETDAASGTLRDATVATVPDASAARDAAPLDANTAPPRDAAPPTRPDAAPPMVDASQPARDAAPPVMEAAAPTCNAPERLCGTRCVDTRSDGANCGGCGMQCAQGESCVESKCYPAPQNGCASRSFNNHAYLFCSNVRTYRDARQSCLEQRMDLVIVDDVPENDFVRGIGAVTWMGASDLDEEGRFRQVVRGQGDRFNGAELTFTRWGDGEPNNDRRCNGGIGSLCIGGDWVDEDCGQVYSDGNWNDGWCAQEQRYVCESY